MNDKYQRQVRLGQAINLANDFILATQDCSSMSIENYKKELRDKTEVFLSFINSMQDSYANAVKVAEDTFNQAQAKKQQQDLYGL